MNLMPPGYDKWALQGPDEPHQIGRQDGELCGRHEEPDEDNPKPKPCPGEIVECGVEFEGDRFACILCGEVV
jgi:hypothetical protein